MRAKRASLCWGLAALLLVESTPSRQRKHVSEQRQAMHRQPALRGLDA